MCVCVCVCVGLCVKGRERGGLQSYMAHSHVKGTILPPISPFSRKRGWGEEKCLQKAMGLDLNCEWMFPLVVQWYRVLRDSMDGTLQPSFLVLVKWNI